MTEELMRLMALNDQNQATCRAWFAENNPRALAALKRAIFAAAETGVIDPRLCPEHVAIIARLAACKFSELEVEAAS